MRNGKTLKGNIYQKKKGQINEKERNLPQTQIQKENKTKRFREKETKKRILENIYKKKLLTK